MFKSELKLGVVTKRLAAFVQAFKRAHKTAGVRMRPKPLAKRGLPRLKDSFSVIVIFGFLLGSKTLRQGKPLDGSEHDVMHKCLHLRTPRGVGLTVGEKSDCDSRAAKRDTSEFLRLFF